MTQGDRQHTKRSKNPIHRVRRLQIANRSILRKIPASSGFILAIKLNSVEFQNKGFLPEECRDLCQLLEHEAHFDFVELSGGTYEDTAFEHKRDSTRKREAFFLEFAEAIVPVLTKTKVYVTGGFLTVAAMETALETVDGVGLARTLCTEPHLALDIVSGRIRSGAINAGLSQYDYGMTGVVAGVQMRQIGNDRAPIDLTKEDNLKAFESSVARWERDLEADSESMTLYGSPDIDGANLPSFAAANAWRFARPMLV
ncbi:Aldolase-type TIM barrel [Penicillium cf. griseofulvum]|uniref:Aldolase-type TIM barrel n=1 Tax=Penicillium cf. griseofulvum TaxID=2972120 RepID=A0A9W9MEG0_9EURO|nr:Aldolase-type TIM barrel [Penicillium cf. griseofulvum]KAJ5442765.1 Aldolase-type TIM barrel [Penicillium cf. griseofulvum]KAJ5451419.1 Aldolase-type TIM barrel [Penicillium cf. griseofulvum]